MTIKLCDCCGQETDSLCIMSGYKRLSNGDNIQYRPVELCNACFERTYEKIRRYCVQIGYRKIDKEDKHE